MVIQSTLYIHYVVWALFKVAQSVERALNSKDCVLTRPKRTDSQTACAGSLLTALRT